MAAVAFLALLALQAGGTEADAPLPTAVAPAAESGFGGLHLADFESELVGLYRKLRPSLVGVRMTLYVEGMEARELTSSGVVLDHWGLVIAPVTLPRDVGGVEVREIYVERLDETLFPAEVLAHSDAYNLSLLRARDLLGMGPELGLASSLEPGAMSFAMGNAFGLPGNFSVGLVSGTNRRLASAGQLLQITNPINPGDRGGILANRRGEVVGVLLSSLSGAARGLEAGEWGDIGLQSPGARERLALQRDAVGVSFAVPVEVLGALFPEHLGQLFAGRRMLGVEVAPTVLVEMSSEGEPRREVLLQVRGVVENSVASAAGLRYGDVLLTLGGCPVATLPELGYAIREAGPSTALQVLRDGRPLELEVRFGTATDR